MPGSGRDPAASTGEGEGSGFFSGTVAGIGVGNLFKTAITIFYGKILFLVHHGGAVTLALKDIFSEQPVVMLEKIDRTGETV